MANVNKLVLICVLMWHQKEWKLWKCYNLQCHLVAKVQLFSLNWHNRWIIPCRKCLHLPGQTFFYRRCVRKWQWGNFLKWPKTIAIKYKVLPYTLKNSLQKMSIPPWITQFSTGAVFETTVGDFSEMTQDYCYEIQCIAMWTIAWTVAMVMV